MTNTTPHTQSPFTVDLWEPDANSNDESGRAKQALSGLKRLYDDGLPLLKLVEQTNDLAEIQQIADTIIAQSDTVVLVGIGGSSLGAEALTALRPIGHSVKLEVMDNPDPDSFAVRKATLDPKTTSWLFVSKSGGTLETVSQVMMVLDWLENAIGKDEIAKRCTIVTEPKPSAMTTLADHYSIPRYTHDPELGGRWTCVANVGLVPAAACGVDIQAFRRGCHTMLQHTLSTDIQDNQPLQGALYGVRQAEQGRNTHAIMPYMDRLKYMAAWCRQLVSESLGKQGKGITPLAALGTVDQHSMLQLLLDGPDNKYFTVVTADQEGKGSNVPSALAKLCGLDYLADIPLGNVLNAFQRGTIGSMQASKRPVRTIHMPALDAFHLGALLMSVMLETILIAQMIGVDAFDQPAVEDSKIRAKKVLGA